MTLSTLHNLLYRCVLLIATLAGPTLTMAADPGTPTPIADQSYRLIKDWTFGRTILNLDDMRAEFYTRYVYNGGTLDRLNNEWERYRDNNNHEFSNTGFSLVARVPLELKSGQIESGMLRSKWIGQYGYFEARMKVPTGRGLWPAFWLNPQDQTWPPEIDIMEIVNNGRDTTKNSFHILHSGDGKSFPSTMSLLDKWGSYRPGFDYADDFHTFAVLWEPGRVRHYVDEKLIADRPFYWLHKSGADAGSAHVLVNLAVGGDWPGAPQDINDFPARLQIDYIRIWQK